MALSLAVALTSSFSMPRLTSYDLQICPEEGTEPPKLPWTTVAMSGTGHRWFDSSRLEDLVQVETCFSRCFTKVTPEGGNRRKTLIAWCVVGGYLINLNTSYSTS